MKILSFFLFWKHSPLAPFCKPNLMFPENMAAHHPSKWLLIVLHGLCLLSGTTATLRYWFCPIPTSLRNAWQNLGDTGPSSI